MKHFRQTARGCLTAPVDEPRDLSYSTVMGWLRCRLSFCLLRCAVMCFRGSQSRHTTALDNVPSLACSAARVSFAAWVCLFHFVRSTSCFVCLPSFLLSLRLVPLFCLVVVVVVVLKFWYFFLMRVSSVYFCQCLRFCHLCLVTKCDPEGVWEWFSRYLKIWAFSSFSINRATHEVKEIGLWFEGLSRSRCPPLKMGVTTAIFHSSGICCGRKEQL